MVAATLEHTETLRVRSLEVENFLKVNALTIQPNGKHVLIEGPNGAGKTSAIEAIYAALKNVAVREVPEPIHDGADKAVIRLELGTETETKYIVRRAWTEKGSRLEITTPEGSKIREPQKLLDSLFADYALDPMKFLNQRPQDQIDDVLRVCGVKPPVSQVLGIINETFGSIGADDERLLKPLQNESADQYLMRLSADETGVFYVRRRESGRTAEQKKSALDDQANVLESLGGPMSESEQPQSPDALTARLNELSAISDRRLIANDKLAAVRRNFDSAKSTWNSFKERQARKEQDIAATKAAIEKLQQELATQEFDARTIETHVANARETCNRLSEEGRTALAEYGAIPDTGAETQQVLRQLEEVVQANSRITRRKHVSDQVTALTLEHANAVTHHKHHDDILEKLRYLRVHLLDGVDLGISGLEIGQGELRLNGVSFRQASKAQRISVSCALAMISNPRLRLMRIDDGEHLDAKSWELLLQLAEKFDFQIIMTRVANIENLSVHIVEPWREAA